MILREILGETISLLCLSEFWYYNKNEYFDLLESTQYSGGYKRWIKHFVRVISEVANRSAKLFERYEIIIARDEERLKSAMSFGKSVRLAFNHLKRFPVVNIASVEKKLTSHLTQLQRPCTFCKKRRLFSRKGLMGETASGNIQN